MFAIIGATGKVGRSTSEALRYAGAPVTAVLHDPAKRVALTEIGCSIAVADIQDAAALATAIQGADAVQVIVPLRPQTPDPVADMQRTIEGVLGALQRARPKRVLLISDYGAHIDADIGMPSIFHDVENRLRQVGGEIIVLRSAEHMHNWGRNAAAALESGTLVQLQDPVDALQPTIAAEDLGRIAAELLLRPTKGDGVEIFHAEGPRRYSASDVAAVVTQMSGKPVRAIAVPRGKWNAIFSNTPPSLANLLIRAADAKNRGGLVEVEPGVPNVRHGGTELTQALKPILPLR